MKEAQAIRRRSGRIVLVAIAALFLGMAWMFLYGSPAAAQVDPYSTQTPDVLPTRITDDKEPKIEPDIVEGSKPEPRDAVLPFTGGDVVLFVLVGAAAVGTGFFIVRRTRSDN